MNDFTSRVRRSLTSRTDSEIDYPCLVLNVPSFVKTLLQLKDEEIVKLLDGFEEGSVLPMNGLFLGGQKYMVLQGDPGIVVRGKKVRDPFVTLCRVGFENGWRG